jgi:hypothetical protein
MTSMTSPAHPLLRVPPLLGALAGALLFVGCLAAETFEGDRWLAPAFGCSPPPGYNAANLLAAVYPVASLAPQQAGESEDARRSADWNATGFFLLGLNFYSASGLLVGSLFLGGAVLSKRLKSGNTQSPACAPRSGSALRRGAS